MSNLDLWDRVEKTNPNHTKQVTFGRAITAIDPYRQIKNATEQFGPAGKGWGWSVVDTKFLPTNEVACLVRLWHGSDTQYIEQWGQNGLFIDKAEKKKDTDCMKKATTDGLTKCLSLLGFNADIFLGKFEDNKYVQDLKKEVADKEKKEAEDKVISEYQALCEPHMDSINAIKESIASGNYSSGSEAWKELSEDEKGLLWRAPKKGGLFTTNEISVMKSKEFREGQNINVKMEG